MTTTPPAPRPDLLLGVRPGRSGLNHVAAYVHRRRGVNCWLTQPQFAAAVVDAVLAAAVFLPERYPARVVDLAAYRIAQRYAMPGIVTAIILTRDVREALAGAAGELA